MANEISFCHVDVRARSSISNTDLSLANSVGLIDNGYRGEIKVRFRILPLLSREFKGIELSTQYIEENFHVKLYKKGERLAQLVVQQTLPVKIVEVNVLSSSPRQAGGFGSTGNSVIKRPIS